MLLRSSELDVRATRSFAVFDLVSSVKDMQACERLLHPSITQFAIPQSGSAEHSLDLVYNRSKRSAGNFSFFKVPIFKHFEF